MAPGSAAPADDDDNKDRSAESFEGNEENSLDDIENERGHNRLRSKTSQQQQQQHGEASQEQTSTIVTDDDAGGEDAGLIHAGQRPRSGKQGYLARAPRQSSNYDEGNGETDGNERGGTEKEGGSPAALETRRAETEQTERATSDRAGSKQGSGQGFLHGKDDNVDRRSVTRGGKSLSGVGSGSGSSSMRSDYADMPPSRPRPSLSSHHLDSGEVSRDGGWKRGGGRVAGGERPAGRAGRGGVRPAAKKQDEGTVQPPPYRLSSTCCKLLNNGFSQR